MSLEHEYALIGGYNRASVGRWLARVSAAVSAVAVFLLLTAVDVARGLGVNVNLPPAVLSLIGAGIVYAALYWLFDRHIWKFGPIKRALNVADISGAWHCDGVSLDRQPPTPWTGKVIIVQSWDKLRIHLETSQSTSDSISAALLHDVAVGYRFMYHYRNQPRVGQPNLTAHYGFAELVFPADVTTASGDYFNGRGRYTYGTMQITREAH